MDSPKECRICQSTEDELPEEERDVNPMVSPCDCNGSLKYVHKECVIEWMRTSGQLICGVCRTQYNAFPFVRNGLSFGRFLADDPKHRLILSLHAIVSLVFALISVKLWTLLPQIWFRMQFNRKLRKYFFSLIILYPIEVILITISWTIWYFTFKRWQNDNFEVVFLDAITPEE